jgi:beta-lactam-binding protein with PASTA domain
MTRHLVGVGVVGVAAASMMLIATGVAHAATPSVVGQKYSDASSALSSAGYTATIGASFGDTLAQSDCIVTSQRTKSTPQKGSHPTNGTKVVVSLNCNATLASAVSPGNSAASPQGRAAAAAAGASATAAPPSGG